MSDYLAKAFNPSSNKIENAIYVDNYYGRYMYGVRFLDGGIHPIAQCGIEQAAVAFDRLTARLAEAEKDAARYRYLRSRDLDTIDKGGVFAGMTPANIILNEEDLDREVDAARDFLKGDGNGK